MDTNKQKASAEELQHMLIAAFDRVRPPACDKCSVPLPKPLPPVATGGVNWWLGPLPECPHGCPSFIGWLWHQFGIRYELLEGSKAAPAPDLLFR